MILYFADRHLNILGQASTHLPKGIVVTDDVRTEDVNSGATVFECDLNFAKETRGKVEEWAELGNYIICDDGDEQKLFTIIDAEIDTKKQTAYIYAEDEGMDLLNEIVGAYEADQPYPIETYIERFAGGAGWDIGVNEAEGLTKKLTFDNEETASARLLQIAEAFNDCELSYSFKIKGLKVVKKYINIYEERGKDTGVQLRLNKEIDSIITTKSIANMATALRATGGTPDNADKPITLLGYEYDDGDFYVDGHVLKSRKALEKWSRYLWKGDDTQQQGGHIVKTYSDSSLSRAVLCSNAIKELKSICDMEVNYEADIKELPEHVKVGDRVNIIDDEGGLYLSSRILSLETSAANNTRKAIIGEHLIRKSGISTKVEKLAAEFAERAQEIARAQAAANEAKAQAAAAAQDIAAAQEAANEAKNLASNAEASAADAKIQSAAAELAAKAAEAATTEAVSKAETALTKAEGIEATANEAKAQATEASTVAQAAKLDAEKAKEDIDALGEDLETVTSTMQADYARKTDLTEATASLQTQITRNANEISSTATKVSEIDETANNAAEKADQAQSTAANATAKADAAQADATAAQNAANEATSKANAAETAATNARQAAENAQADADAAAGKVATAEAELAEAKSNLAAVQSKVDATETEIAEAQAAVEAAQTAANQAKADAQAAQNTADKAKTDAATAQSAANTAKQAADAAQNKADEAKAAADKAQADANALAKRVTTAETNISQNSEQIALRATKEEVTQTLGGYYTKAQTEAAITAKADSITSTVKSTYATKQEVEEIEIGGRNLIQGTMEQITTTSPSDYNYQYLTFIPTVLPLEEGGSYAISADAEILTGEFDKISVKLYDDNLQTQYAEVLPTIENGHIAGVFENVSSNATRLLLYAGAAGSTAGNSVIFSNIKFEKGNKPTDWTPAPEDIDEGIATAQNDANTAKEEITAAQTIIQQLSDAISMLVVDEDGTTLMQQTSEGWSFNLTSAEKAATALQETVSELQESTGNTQATVETLQQAIADVEAKTDYVNIEVYKYTDENGTEQTEPCIELGETDSDSKLLVTNKRILFQVGTSEPTQITQSGVVTKNIEVEEELIQGIFVWKRHGAGNLGLTRKGASS